MQTSLIRVAPLRSIEIALLTHIRSLARSSVHFLTGGKEVNQQKESMGGQSVGRGTMDRSIETHGIQGHQAEKAIVATLVGNGRADGRQKDGRDAIDIK